LSSITVAYRKPKTTIFTNTSIVDNVKHVVNTSLAGNMFPTNLERILEESPAYRDLLIYECLTGNYTVEQALNILGTFCRYIGDIYKIKKLSEVRVCEVIITLAYIYQDKYGYEGDEFKALMEETFLRVPYDKATDYLKLIYETTIASQAMSPKDLENLFIYAKNEIYTSFLKEDKVY